MMILSAQGYSICVLISESHASIHTFPEDNGVFIDYFTCGNISTEPFRQKILEALKPYKIIEDKTFVRPNEL